MSQYYLSPTSSHCDWSVSEDGRFTGDYGQHRPQYSKLVSDELVSRSSDNLHRAECGTTFQAEHETGSSSNAFNSRNVPYQSELSQAIQPTLPSRRGSSTSHGSRIGSLGPSGSQPRVGSHPYARSSEYAVCTSERRSSNTRHGEHDTSGVFSTVPTVVSRTTSSPGLALPKHRKLAPYPQSFLNCVPTDVVWFKHNGSYGILVPDIGDDPRVLDYAEDRTMLEKNGRRRILVEIQWPGYPPKSVSISLKSSNGQFISRWELLSKLCSAFEEYVISASVILQVPGFEGWKLSRKIRRLKDVWITSIRTVDGNRWFLSFDVAMS